MADKVAWALFYLGCGCGMQPHMVAWRPPSTGIKRPVKKDDCSEARKEMTRATSSHSAMRPAGCMQLAALTNWNWQWICPWVGGSVGQFGWGRSTWSALLGSPMGPLGLVRRSVRTAVGLWEESVSECSFGEVRGCSQVQQCTTYINSLYY